MGKSVQQGFKSPAAGWPEGDPYTAYRVDVEFASQRGFLDFKPWETCAELAELLGEHTATFNTFVKDRVLIPTGLPWVRYRRDGAALSLGMDVWAREDTWRAAEPVLARLAWLSARRQCGRLKRTVWEMHFSPWCDWVPNRSHFQWTFVLAACDVRRRDEKALSMFFERLYGRAAEADCLGGRAKRVERDRDIDRKRFDGFWTTGETPADRSFQHATSQLRPIVPYISAVSLLTPAHLDRLGDPGLLSGMAKHGRTEGDGYAHFLVKPLPRGRVAVAIGDESPVSVRRWGLPEEQPNLWRCEHARLLHIAMLRRGMIHGFDDDAYSKAHDWVVKGIEPRSTRDVEVSPPPAAAVSAQDVIEHLRTHPPRCLRGHGRLIEPKRKPGKKGAGTGKAASDVWQTLDIGFELDTPTTLYGVKRSDHPLLHSPILAGSTKADRAIFHFDLDEHGFDGEQLGRELPRSPRRLTQFVCPECQSRVLKITADFEFDIAEWGLGTDAMAQRPQDFFTWLNIRVACAACDWTGEAASIECA